ncbi:choline transporter-like protein 3 isoform X1 [Cricetulus griseus]|uniref:choline transporter-like protein 3 isoform X1 n=1 Tax=Cricetulus griseus TaxID=10029 RepID=UPI0015C3E9B6|nr:choline transporter-like protein 3 isoform X1 [Cricetulus griseus]
MNACDLQVKDRWLGRTALCVSRCPEKQLDTLEEIQLFADINGSSLCVYSLNSFNYTQSPNADTLCPRLPVPPSKSFPLLNRCIPQTPECYSLFASVLINDADALHRILSGIMAGRDTILGLCVFTFALSLAMLFAFRFISTLLVHIIISLVILGLLFVCGVLWWLYYDYTNDLSTELDTERENMKCMLAFAIVTTVMTAVLLVLIFTLRKRIKLTVELLQVTNKAISTCPFLLFQPLWTFAILIFFWVLWVTVLLSLGTAVFPIPRNQSDPPAHPILSSLSILFCYHQGTAVKGSFLITVTRIPRVILMHMYNTLREPQCGAWSRGVFRCNYCGFRCLARHLQLLNQNAYTAAAINGTDFCTSAKDAHKIMSKNTSHLMSVNCFGNFVIFLGKVLVVCFTVFGGLMAFNYNRALQVWAIPLLLVAFFAYLVAHSFLSVFETVLDILFLCFAVDLETNDGSSEKPYFMHPEFLSFITRTNNCNNARPRGHRDSLPNEEGTELRPIVR